MKPADEGKDLPVDGVEPCIDISPTMSPTDERSIAAFEAQLRAHDGRVRALAYRMVRGDVDDVLQQAYLKAFVEYPHFRGESTFVTWLHRIVYTTALDHLRSAERRDRLQRRTAIAERVGDGTDRVVDQMMLDAALDKLPVDQRAVLILVDGQGMSYDDAARVLDVASGTIASRLFRARAAVRDRLTDGGAR